MKTKEEIMAKINETGEAMKNCPEDQEAEAERLFGFLQALLWTLGKDAQVKRQSQIIGSFLAEGNQEEKPA